MRTALIVMAAGIGSRFGGGIKQLEKVGPKGEIIMDYSVHDALQAGFNKIIFIIRRDIEKEFREVIGNQIEKLCSGIDVEIQYAFQAQEDIPEGFEVPEGRRKPWGTGQAVLSCRDLIKEPFAVINADDYYGKEAFIKLFDFLRNYSPENPSRQCMAGFVLKNTLSDNGGVTRGICQIDDAGYLTQVKETYNIIKISKNSEIFAESNGERINPNSLVSMNMWGLTPEFAAMLQDGFTEFLTNIRNGNGDGLKSEYLLPVYIDEMLKKDKISVKVLETSDKWFGVTYREDKQTVIESFKELINSGVYSEDLFSDIK